MIALPLALACARSADVRTPAEGDTGSDADADADTDTDADADTDDLVADETDGELALPFALDVDGRGTDGLGAVTLLDAAGTLTLDGVDHATVAYQDHDWASAGYHLYDLVSVADDGSDLAVTYLYCQGDGLPYAYTESYARPMGWERTSGTCAGAATASTAGVSLPALRALPPAFDPGVRIDGDDVSWDGDAGHVTLSGVDRDLHPFDVVDCTDCPGGPWLEVHSLLVGDDACFAILYLYPDDPTYVQVEYGLCLPTLARPSGSLSATWTGGFGGPPAPPPGLLRPAPTRAPPR